MSSFWSGYIIVLVIFSVVATAVFLYLVDKAKFDVEEGESLGHSFDGIEELNNPLPKWWTLLFWATIFYTIAYLILYPGLGNFQGYLNWSSESQLQQEMALAEKAYGPIFEKYGNQSIDKLVTDPEALAMGQRLFANHCAGCHGSDAGGSVGFPNLNDQDWLYGSSSEAIKTSIQQGRRGMMPAMEMVVGGPEGVAQVAAYVLSLSGRSVDPTLAQQGKQKFQTACVACHGIEGQGNQLLGAPNLSDKIWLYGGSDSIVKQSIAKGRSGNMPAHKDLLSEEKIHIITAYVSSLSK